MADDQDQGYVPLYQPGAQKPAPAAAAPPQQAPAPVRDPNDQGYVPLVSKPAQTQQTGGGQQTGGDSQPSGWGVNLSPPWVKGGGDVTMPQSVTDFGTVAGNEAMAGTLPGLRAQAEAARKRLPDAAAAGADFAGNVLSPTQLLTPFAGPEAAGGLHEGVKSAVTNWKPDENWPTYLKNVGEDAGLGAAFGYGGRVVAGQAPKYLGDATREMVKGIPAGLWGLHAVQMGQDMAHNMATAAETFGAYGLMNRAGTWAGRQVEGLGSSPAVQQAIKSVILGGGSAARQQIPGPLDQLFMPGN